MTTMAPGAAKGPIARLRDRPLVEWLDTAFVPLVFFATRNWGLVGAWSCFIVHVALLAGLLAIRVRGRTWIERGASLLDAERVGGASASVSQMDDLRSSPAV